MSYKVVDLRGVIPGQPWASQGPREKTDGVTIHYNGPATGVPAGRVSPRRLFANDAAYHMRPGVFEAKAQNGIQYHFGVWHDTVYILRNPKAILYHCGAWPQNGTAWAINVPIGGNERASKRTIHTLRDFVNDQLEEQGRGRAWCAGHQELNATACPGTLMADFVRPYRSASLGLPPQGSSQSVSEEKPTPKTLYRPRAGLFSDQGYADALAIELRSKKFSASVERHNGYWAVFAGAFENYDGAKTTVQALHRAGYNEAFIEVVEKA